MPPMSTFEVEYQTYDESVGCSSQTDSPVKSPLVASRRRVRFSRHIGVQEVPHLKDLTQEEGEAIWYSPEEFEEIRKSLVVTVRMMVANKPVDDTQCTRGLEFRTPAGAKQRKRNKLNALTAVWNEQVSQWKEDRTDEEAIAFVYQQHGHECKKISLRMALQDEKDARRYQECLDESESGSDLSTISLDDSADDQTLQEPRKAVVTPSAA